MARSLQAGRGARASFVDAFLGLAARLVIALLVLGAPLARAAPPDTDSAGPPDGTPASEVPAEPASEVPTEPASEVPSEPASERPRPPPSLLPGTNCDIYNPGDPLYPVIEALAALRTSQLELRSCEQLTERGPGRRLIEAQLVGSDQDLMLYRLERLAADGFEIFLSPIGKHEVLMAARPAASAGGVYYLEVDEVSLDGSFVKGDDHNRVATIIGLRDGDFYPFEYATRLAELGYRAEFFPVGKGAVLIEVEPGRSLRRVRVRGHLPLSKRDVLRQLSVDAQPGALARGKCVAPKRLREGAPPPICDGRDVACLEWERDEVARLDEFLFDHGYFDGRASLALVCGRARDEADLYVYLDKQKGYKVARNLKDDKGRRVEGHPITVHDLDVEASGGPSGEALEERDVRWIRRQFTPKVLALFRTRITRDFMDRANQRVISAYADPNAGLGRFWRSEAGTPHPEVELRSSYDTFDRETLHKSHNVPLDVYISRGPAVQTEFKPTPGSKTKGSRNSGLSFSDGQLRNHIQLFNRREPASTSAAQRESANLRAYYQSKGYLFASVEGQHFDFKTLSKLRFEIDEGPKVKVASVSITRPARLDEDVARRIERSWDSARELRRRGRFSETAALADMQSVLAAYNTEGYLCASVQIKVAFWPQALNKSSTYDDEARKRGETPRREVATITIADLLDSGGSAKWLSDFDPAGLAAVMAQDHADIWVRFEIIAGPRIMTAASVEQRFLDEPIAFSRKVIDPVTRESQDSKLADDAIADSPLRPQGRDADPAGNVPVTLELGRELRRSVVARYRGEGYPISDAELTWTYAAPDGQRFAVDAARNLTDTRLGICTNRRTDPVVEIEPVVNIYEGKIGEFGEILLRGNFKTRDWVLRRELRFETGQRYDQRLVDASAASLEATGVARGVTIAPYPVDCQHDSPGVCQVHEVVTIEEAKDLAMTIDFGFGVATLDPFYVFANPRFPNLWGTAWDLGLESRWGFGNALERPNICAGQDCYERLFAATLSRPHIFATEINLDINGRIQQRATPARGNILSIVGSLRLSRRFRSWTFYTGYLFQLANISKDLVKPLAGTNGGWINRGGGVVPDLTGLIDTGAVLTRTDNAFNPHEGYLATMDVKLASPWLGGRDWWARLDLSWQHFIPLHIPGTQDRLNFRYSLRYGHLFPFKGPGFQGLEVNTETVPDVWRYYGGGTADLGIRGILPETMLVDVEEVALPYGGVIYRPRAQGGHIRAIGTVALQVTSVRDIFGGALAHSLFYDFGVLTQFWNKVDLRRDFRHSVGTNFLKLDIGIVTMAIGYAILLPGQYNRGPTDDKNGRFIFDVGVTF